MHQSRDETEVTRDNVCRDGEEAVGAVEWDAAVREDQWPFASASKYVAQVTSHLCALEAYEVQVKLSRYSSDFDGYRVVMYL